MVRLAGYATVAILASLSLLFLKNPIAVGLLCGLATGLAVPAIDTAIANSRYLRLAWATLRLGNQEVRVSISYLYRIEQGGLYFLVQGGRRPHQYQPVGGVYKFNPSARNLLQGWNVRTDNLIPIDEVSQEDLRIRLPGRYLIPFLRWFEGEQCREVGPWREFYEELVKTGLLPRELFPHVRADFVRRRIDRIQYSPYAQCMQLLIADVYELIPNDTQRTFLEQTKLDVANTRQYIWVDADRIKRRGAVPGKKHELKVSETAEWIL